MCDQLKNSKAQKFLLSFTNYRDKVYDFIEVFLMKDKFKQHTIKVKVLKKTCCVTAYDPR